MENSKESQDKFLDALIINFLEKFNKYTSNLENNEDNNEFHTMIFILSYITSNNLIDTATLNKYLNGNQIYEVFKKKRTVLNELSEKYKDKKQEGGGFFGTLLKFVAVLSIFNTVVESHVNVEPQALTNKTRIVELFENNPELIHAIQLINPDGRCALIQALIANPPEEADGIIKEFTEYFIKKEGFGWSPKIINPQQTEFEDGNIYIERGFTEDFGNKEYVSIYGFDLSTIMKYVKDTIKEIMDDVFSQPGYVDGQISMSLIGVPGHAETLLLRKHNGNTYYGILETNVIGYIDFFSRKEGSSSPFYTVQPGFFTQEELESMSTLYSSIVTETDNPIENVIENLGSGKALMLAIQLEMPTKQSPTQTHIPALVIPYTSGKKLEELGIKMNQVIVGIMSEAQDEVQVEIPVQYEPQPEPQDENRPPRYPHRNPQDEDKSLDNVTRAERESAYSISDGIIDLWNELEIIQKEAREQGRQEPDLKDLDKIIQIFEKIEIENNKLKVKLNDSEYNKFLDIKSEQQRLLDMSENDIEYGKEFLNEYKKKLQPLKSANIQPLKSANIQPLKSANIQPLQSANRFSVFADDDENDETIPKPAMSESKRYKNKEKKSRNAFNQRESKRQTKKEVNNYIENMKKAHNYSLLSRKGKKLLGPENYVGNMNYVGNNINLGGKINKTRRKMNKNNSKTKTKRRNKNKTKRRNKSRRRN